MNQPNKNIKNRIHFFLRTIKDKSVCLPVFIAVGFLIVGYFWFGGVDQKTYPDGIKGTGKDGPISLGGNFFGLGVELIENMRSTDGVPFQIVSNFAFDESHFHCAVVSNDGEFIMPTHALGNVKVDKQTFAMSVDSTYVESVKKMEDGTIQMLGTAISSTRVNGKYEEAIVPFKVLARDGGRGHKEDSLELTVFYNEDSAPLQFAVFGPEPRFGHGIISGDIRYFE